MRSAPLLLALLLALAGCSAVGDPEPAKPAASPPRDESAVRGEREDLSSAEEPATAPSEPAAQARPEAPEIAGTTLDGEEIALSDFRGKPVFVKVWASW